MNNNKLLILLIFCLFAIPVFTNAHSGRTDSSGGHNCRVGSCAGTYHYHNGGYTTPSYTNTSYTNTSYTNTQYDTYTTCSAYGTFAMKNYAGNCECMSGYVFGKNFLGEDYCVSADSVCSDEYGYNARYNSLYKSCECSYGYTFGKDSLGSTTCISDDKACQNQLGYNSRSAYGDMCECTYGYVIGSSGQCEWEGSGTTTDYSCPDNSSISLVDLDKCTCDIGYEINSDSNGCNKVTVKTKVVEEVVNKPLKEEVIVQKIVEEKFVDFTVKESDISILEITGILKNKANFRKCPSTKCSIIKTFSKGIELKVTGENSSEKWYRVSNTIDNKEIVGWVYKSIFEKPQLEEIIVDEPPIIEDIEPVDEIPEKDTRGWVRSFLKWIF